MFEKLLFLLSFWGRQFNTSVKHKILCHSVLFNLLTKK